ITLALSILAAIVTLGVAAIWRLNRQTSAPREENGLKAIGRMPLAPAALKIDQVTTYGNVMSAAISPDGKQLAYAEENDGRYALWLRQLATAVNVRIVPPAYAAYNKINFSHDGNYVYFTRHGENEASDLYRIPALGGPPIKLHENV